MSEYAARASVALAAADARGLTVMKVTRDRMTRLAAATVHTENDKQAIRALERRVKSKANQNSARRVKPKTNNGANNARRRFASALAGRATRTAVSRAFAAKALKATRGGPRGMGVRNIYAKNANGTYSTDPVSLNRIPVSRAVRVNRQVFDSKTLRALLQRDPGATNPLTRQPFPRHVYDRFARGARGAAGAQMLAATTTWTANGYDASPIDAEAVALDDDARRVLNAAVATARARVQSLYWQSREKRTVMRRYGAIIDDDGQQWLVVHPGRVYMATVTLVRPDVARVALSAGFRPTTPPLALRYVRREGFGNSATFLVTSFLQ